MDPAEAQQRLERMCAYDQDPALGESEIADLLELSKRPDKWGNSPKNTEATTNEWAAATAYGVGEVIRPTSGTGRFLRCVYPGTSGSSEPSWPSDTTRLGGRLGDNTVIWESAGTTWEPNWDLNAGAAEGWLLKAGKASGRYKFATDGQTFNRSEVIANCFEMEARYRKKVNGTTDVKRN